VIETETAASPTVRIRTERKCRSDGQAFVIAFDELEEEVLQQPCLSTPMRGVVR
jgi:hypothetical protein